MPGSGQPFTLSAVPSPFIGAEAIAAGHLTPYALRSRHTAIYPGVHVARGAPVTAAVKAEAAWLWCRRRGIVAGRSAAALHRAKWVASDRPAEVIHDNRRPPPGLRTWCDVIADDEIAAVGGIRVTSAVRTALDLGCRRKPLHQGVAEIDALLRATRIDAADVESLLLRYPGRRGIRNARDALHLADSGAESPRETWLRLLLIRSGLPRPQTQIRVVDEFGQIVARLDMGWPDLMIAVEYDGDHHWNNRRQLADDIRRAEMLRELGWIVIRVTAEDGDATIIGRVNAAFARRT